MFVLTFVYTHIRLKVLVPKEIFQGNARQNLVYAVLLSFIFTLLTQTNESLSGTKCLYHRQLSVKTQTNPTQHHPPVPAV